MNWPGWYRIDEAALNALPDETLLTLRKTGALRVAYAQLFSMNQLAMLPKAARMQAQIKGQLAAKATGQALSQAQVQAQPVSDLDFLFPPGDTLKFSSGHGLPRCVRDDSRGTGPQRLGW